MKPISKNHVISSDLKDIHSNSSNQIDEIKDEKLNCGFSSDSVSVGHKHKSLFNMLVWLKSVAIDHYWTETLRRNFQESQNQMISVRKFIFQSHNDVCPRLLVEAVTTTSDLSRGKDQYSVPSSNSGLINCADSEGSSEQIQNPQHRPIKLLKSGNNDPRKQVRIGPPKRVRPIFKHNDSVNVANSSGSKKARKYMTPQKSSKSLDVFGEDFPSFPIPVGPRFQADIPDLSCKPNCLADEDANSDKWLGTCIWPIEDRNADTIREFIGKGRPYSCSCNSPGSTHCIKLHIGQNKLQLQHDLGSAFFDWKFDEMGEEVAKSWKPSEQKSFELLVKRNPTSKKSFWKPALKLFSSKSRKSIVSYYFNVLVLRRMSRQTRLACKVVDTDDDETDDEGVDHSKDTKTQYLTGFR